MTAETTETHVVTDLPASKQSRFRNPFAKSESDQTSTEEPTRKHRAPRGAKMAGLLLLAAGVGAALGSKLGKETDEDAESTDTEFTDN